MSDPKTRAEQLEALAEYAAMAELERIDALSPEELHAELEAEKAGAPDPRVAEAADPAPPPSLDGPERGSGVRERRGWRRLSVPLGLSAAAGALAIAFARYMNLFGPPVIANPDHPAPSSTDMPAPAPREDDPERVAGRLRVQAKAACDRGAWDECAARLAEAAAIDPDGDDADEVNALRKRADDGKDEEKQVDRKARP